MLPMNSVQSLHLSSVLKFFLDRHSFFFLMPDFSFQSCQEVSDNQRPDLFVGLFRSFKFLIFKIREGGREGDDSVSI